MEFDKPKYLKLKKAYQKAVREQLKSFTFDGEELLTVYAKYVLEYIDMKFK